MTDCKHRDAVWNPCKFEARYNEIPPDKTFAAYDLYYHPTLITELTKLEYVCDVCIRCGKTNKDSV